MLEWRARFPGVETTVGAGLSSSSGPGVRLNKGVISSLITSLCTSEMSLTLSAGCKG